jgi:hypothetical protein
MIHGLLDMLTPPQWLAVAGLIGLVTFLYRIGASITKAANRLVKKWDMLVEGFPAFGEELSKIRVLLEAGQGRMERHETRIKESEERIGVLKGHVEVLTVKTKETSDKVHDIILRENLAKASAKA